VPERKLSFEVCAYLPISASDSNLNPRNTQCIPAVSQGRVALMPGCFHRRVHKEKQGDEFAQKPLRLCAFA